MQPDTHAQSSAGNCRKLQSLHLHTALRHAASDPACQSPPDSDPGFHGHCTLLDLNLQTLQLIVITPPGGLEWSQPSMVAKRCAILQPSSYTANLQRYIHIANEGNDFLTYNYKRLWEKVSQVLMYLLNGLPWDSRRKWVFHLVLSTIC